MTKHFEFDEIGKKTPYRIPDGFFDEMQKQVLQQAVEESHRKNILLRRISYAVIGMAAAVSAFIFIPRNTAKTEQQPASISWVEQMSDEDLKAMDDMSEYDIFMY